MLGILTPNIWVLHVLGLYLNGATCISVSPDTRSPEHVSEVTN